ncbi:MAG: cytidylyltransferase domain-containing protein [Opitutales bacterium]
MKLIAMIPARLGSERVEKKNLRLILGKPLVAYIIEVAKESGAFDEIYLNSEGEIFREIADEYGVSFYKRPAEFAQNSTVNDEFLEDFVLKHEADQIFQLLPTSPLVTAEEIRSFVQGMNDGSYLTYVTVVRQQIACMQNGKALNFSMTDTQRQSQIMEPIFSYGTVFMGYDRANFLKNMKEYGAAYHGCGERVGYFELSGLSTIDIDNESDFKLAEVAIKSRAYDAEAGKPEYYGESRGHHVEVDVPSILKGDGVMVGNFDEENLPVTDVQSIIDRMDSSESWIHRIVNTESNSMTIISQPPGEGNRLHYHPDWNEWWYILKGKWKWTIAGEEQIINAGQVVFIPKNVWHKITCVGDEPAIRMAVSRADVAHIYED